VSWHVSASTTATGSAGARQARDLLEKAFLASYPDALKGVREQFDAAAEALVALLRSGWYGDGPWTIAVGGHSGPPGDSFHATVSTIQAAEEETA
jgi:hypothetical protein